MPDFTPQPTGSIIETRYRDIPWEEAVKCYTEQGKLQPYFWEKHMRGKPINIHIPAGVPAENAVCNGPFFLTTDRRQGRPICVCPHIAEIGD